LKFFLERENWKLNNTFKKDELGNPFGRCLESSTIKVLEKKEKRKNINWQ
jgi:hypothetical protein